jgi:hypothetical protein
MCTCREPMLSLPGIWRLRKYIHRPVLLFSAVLYNSTVYLPENVYSGIVH